MVDTKNRGWSLNKFVGSILIILVTIYCFFWENKYVNSSICFLAIAVVSVSVLFVRRKISIDRYSVILICILFFNFLSIVYTKATFEDATKWCQSILIITIFVVAVKNATMHEISFTKRLAVLGFLFVGGIYAQLINLPIVTFINSILLKGDSLEMNSTMKSWGYYCGFSGYNSVSAIFAMLTISILQSIFFSYSNRIVRIITFAGTLISYVSIIIVQKRGIFIAATVIIILIYWLERLHKGSIKQQIGFFLTVGIVFLIIYFVLNNSDSGTLFLSRFNNSDDISTGRVDIYKTLLDNWTDYFIVGNGAASTKSVFSMNAHNIYIQIFFENGFIGLALYLTWFIGNLLTSFKFYLYNSGPYKMIALTAISFQVGFLIYGLFGNPLNDLYIFTLYALFSSVPFALIKMSNDDKSNGEIL